MFLTERDLSMGSLGIENPAGLVPGEDYYHPVGLRLKYTFTRAANKAPLPATKPSPGYWWVLQQLPTGIWYYDLKLKKGVTAEEAAKMAEAEEAAKAPAPAQAAQAATEAAVAKPSPAGMPGWVKPVGIAAVVGLGLWAVSNLMSGRQ